MSKDWKLDLKLNRFAFGMPKVQRSQKYLDKRPPTYDTTKENDDWSSIDQLYEQYPELKPKQFIQAKKDDPHVPLYKSSKDHLLCYAIINNISGYDPMVFFKDIKAITQHFGLNEERTLDVLQQLEENNIIQVGGQQTYYIITPAIALKSYPELNNQQVKEEVKESYEEQSQPEEDEQSQPEEDIQSQPEEDIQSQPDDEQSQPEEMKIDENDFFKVQGTKDDKNISSTQDDGVLTSTQDDGVLTSTQVDGVLTQPDQVDEQYNGNDVTMIDLTNSGSE